jgi:hypothetical protein
MEITKNTNAPHAELRKLQKALVLGCTKRGKIKVSQVISATGWKKQKAIAILALLARDGIVERDEYNSNIFWII